MNQRQVPKNENIKFNEWVFVGNRVSPELKIKLKLILQLKSIFKIYAIDK